MALSTTIKQKYMDMKLEDLEKDGYFIEYKNFSDFWNTRIIGKPIIGGDFVFLSAKEYRFKIKEIEIVFKQNIPERYREAITTLGAYAIKCVPYDGVEMLPEKEARQKQEKINGPLKVEVEAKKEEKFIVVNLKYLEDYELVAKLEEEKCKNLEGFYAVLACMDNRNKYITCNQDEPYAEEVWQTILKGEDKKKEGEKDE